MQRLEDLAAFGLKGKRMRRLRYMVSHFAKQGDCSTVEYRPGSCPRTDGEIAAVIDAWGAHKGTVSPFVGDVKREILAGTLAPRYRLFLTRLDDRLENVIMVARMATGSWLMDLEFYPPELPLGGVELAVVRIIEILRKEGATAFSLGATYGPDLGPSANADPDVVELFDRFRARDDFGHGNFQFKNKFSPDESLPLPVSATGSRSRHRPRRPDDDFRSAQPDPAGRADRRNARCPDGAGAGVAGGPWLQSDRDTARSGAFRPDDRLLGGA